MIYFLNPETSGCERTSSAAGIAVPYVAFDVQVCRNARHIYSQLYASVVESQQCFYACGVYSLYILPVENTPPDI